MRMDFPIVMVTGEKDGKEEEGKRRSLVCTAIPLHGIYDMKVLRLQGPICHPYS